MAFAGMLALTSAGLLLWRAADDAVSRNALRRRVTGSALLLAALVPAFAILPGAIAVLAWITAIMACGATVVTAGRRAVSDDHLAAAAGAGGTALVAMHWLLT